MSIIEILVPHQKCIKVSIDFTYYLPLMVSLVVKLQVQVQTKPNQTLPNQTLTIVKLQVQVKVQVNVPV